MNIQDLIDLFTNAGTQKLDAFCKDHGLHLHRISKLDANNKEVETGETYATYTWQHLLPQTTKRFNYISLHCWPRENDHAIDLQFNNGVLFHQLRTEIFGFNDFTKYTPRFVRKDEQRNLFFFDADRLINIHFSNQKMPHAETYGIFINRHKVDAARLD